MGWIDYWRSLEALQFKRPSEEWRFVNCIKNLDGLLDDFKTKYGSLRLSGDAVDISDCLRKPGEPDKDQNSQIFGLTHKRNIVAGYAVFGSGANALHINKYKMRTSVKKPQPYLEMFHHPSDTAKVIAFLCNPRMRNTSLSEVYIPIVELGFDEVQGVRKQDVTRVVEKLRSHYGSFEPSTDDFFMFANRRAKVAAEIRLHQSWLAQFLSLGKGAMEAMSNGEAAMMDEVFGRQKLGAVFSDFRFYYISTKDKPYDKWNYLDEASVFLYLKFAEYARHTGISPTMYCKMSVSQGGYFELKREEVGIVINSRRLSTEIVERQPVKPLSYSGT